MFLDTSAIIEILLSDPKSEDLIRQLEASDDPRSTGPTVVYEAAVVLSGKQNLSVPESERLVRSLLSELNVTVLAATDQIASKALDAFDRYGKGRHPAKLNFGDCFSYAGAKAAGAGLLYVGDDFALTDLA
ncbi:type II toxin-antitoxin system VapC family toxin [Neorhizobium alkalisoli]|uniref:type II toxin-antitoxin system VapC family toxin n=1 Tax=Neorhizobium alkalisoli TaxID=528178 RepID=UPI000CF9CE00|nr:type II toxin-antitoxin system VapC family toxin [Neorhizobium alkalisoli]